MLLASPHVTTLIRLCAGVLDPLRKAQVAVQTSNLYSVETVASMMACYNTFVTVVDTKATYELATKFCGDILEKTSGNASVSQVTCDGHIDYSIRDGAVLADLDELTVPQMSMTFPLAAERSAVIKAVQKFASPAIIAAAKILASACRARLTRHSGARLLRYSWTWPRTISLLRSSSRGQFRRRFALLTVGGPAVPGLRWLLPWLPRRTTLRMTCWATRSASRW